MHFANARGSLVVAQVTYETVNQVALFEKRRPCPELLAEQRLDPTQMLW